MSVGFSIWLLNVNRRRIVRKSPDSGPPARALSGPLATSRHPGGHGCPLWRILRDGSGLLRRVAEEFLDRWMFGSKEPSAPRLGKVRPPVGGSYADCHVVVLTFTVGHSLVAGLFV